MPAISVLVAEGVAPGVEADSADAIEVVLMEDMDSAAEEATEVTVSVAEAIVDEAADAVEVTLRVAVSCLLLRRGEALAAPREKATASIDLESILYVYMRCVWWMYWKNVVVGI